MNCPKCGADLAVAWEFCVKCGTRISKISGETSGPPPCTPPAAGAPSDETSSGSDSPEGPPSGGSTVFVPPSPDSSLPSGQLLAGRWQLEEERGRGGMGIVYRARDAKLRTRTVAVKLLSEQLEGSREGIERFLREAETVAGLNHQSIVQVLDVGEGEGRHFIVMEWIEGEDLGQILEEEGAWDLTRALPLLRQVFQAVSYAHRHGVVHRDLKPSNILVTQEGLAKIVDFGLARMATESDLSKTGHGLGTLAYMPPEQRRDAKRADHRSDIYALGKMVYHILTGQVPDPVDPEALPEAIRPAVMKSLKPDPSDRWFSADLFIQELDRSVSPSTPESPAGAPPSIVPPPSIPTVDDAHTDVRKRPRRVIWGVLGLCFLAALTILGITALENRTHFASARNALERGDLITAADEVCEARGLAVSGAQWRKLATEIGRLLLQSGEDAIAAGDASGANRFYQSAVHLTPPVALEAQSRLAELGVRDSEQVTISTTPESIEIVSTSEPGISETDVAQQEPGFSADGSTTDAAPGADASTDLPSSPEGSAPGQVTTYEICPGMDVMFAWIPAGEFEMGSLTSEGGREADEGPRETVRIQSGFWLGQHEITQAQWQGVMGVNPASFMGRDLPVEQVSWLDADEFIQRLNAHAGRDVYRLPTETEWEYACRAGIDTRFCCGGLEPCLDEHAWFWSNANHRTHPVGLKLPNSWNLYDMHGNVWEWCLDWYDRSSYTTRSQMNPTGPSTGSSRVLRGGSWFTGASLCRSASREARDPTRRTNDVGLRLARSAGRDSSNGDLFLGPSDVVICPEAVLPDEVCLQDSRPNPMWDGAEIAFGLPRAGRVRLTVYDVGGRMVRTLATGEWPGGMHAVRWDRRDDQGELVGTGIYFFRLETAAKTIVRKMIVLD
ncbi:MAG: SUMF1/EgtB/PvdO family nonheme iron enzyme [Candidatus Eisenbacteria sp.]|nr:SUMF1/EgtB/PvdO family nonheme iron enzyme [Candidatus Eisenbacteria bacterium]